MAVGIIDRDVRGVLTASEGEFIKTYRDRPVRCPCLSVDRFGHFVNRSLVQLNRRQIEPGITVRKSKLLNGITGAMHRDRMVVRVDRTNEIGKGA